MKALALDFDGVLADSAREAFAVALRTYVDLDPSSRLAGAAKDASADAQPSLYAGFLAAMPLGNRAEDYGAVLAALEAGVSLPDQHAYDAWFASRSVPWLRGFHERFYQVRAEWARRDPAGWLALCPPFRPLLDLLRRRRGAARYAIATSKDRAAVDRLLSAYGAADLFEPQLVLDKETGHSKLAHLRTLADRLALPYRDITFVEDKLNHLEEAAPLGVRAVLAAWGYNGPRERERALELGFRIATLEGAERVLFGPNADSPPGKLR